MEKIGMRDLKYEDSTPRLHVGSSAFEDWFQQHEKACTGDKQLARDAYAAGMGDPLVTYADGFKWLPIESAPKETTEMFIIRAFNIPYGVSTYTSDPYAVWYDEDKFVRWPHKFAPTHWCPLPTQRS